MPNHTQNNDWFDTLKPYLSKLPPIYAALVAIALLFIGLPQPNSSTCDIKANKPAQSQTQQYNGRAEYERLQIAMGQVQVESILGRGIEIERSPDSTTFTWKNPDCSSITAIFKDGKLQHKYQENLK